MITVPNTKTKITRRFTITGDLHEICKKYISLRPKNTNVSSFFLNYQKGKCTTQKIGINKFGAMGKEVAKYLKLQNPELYTGHCFRRSSATLLVDAGGDITTLKRHGGWKSTSVAEGYIEDSLQNKLNTEKLISGSVNAGTSTSSASSIFNLKKTVTAEENINLDLNTSTNPTLNFAHCSNITINFNTPKH